MAMETVSKILGELIEEAKGIMAEGPGENNINWEKVHRWEKRAKDLLAQRFSNEEAEQFEETKGLRRAIDAEGNFVRHMERKIAYLDSLQKDVAGHPDFWKAKFLSAQSASVENGRPNAIDIITRVCSRFHLVARQLRERHDERPTLEVEDEYDVQDLMHGMLRIFFDDIRPEEWTPSYAGSSARMDFLLKNERFVIETKKTRKGLKAKDLADQLIVDIARYKQHPDCRMLFCFVYDPEGRISNPKGIENDLSRREGDLDVKVFIMPKGA